MSRKGISPLIAAVLLIAFTIAVAGLAGPFLTEITKKAQGDTAEKNQKIVSSTDIRLEIISAEFDSGTGDYTVNLRNSGTSKVENLTITLQGDNPVQKKIDKKIKAGEIHTFTISTNHNKKADKLTAESRNYPVKTDYDLSNAETTSTKTSVSWSTASNWNSGSDNGTVHESVSNTDHDKADNLKQGYGIENPYLSSELLAYYPLQEDSGASNANDFSGYNNDASINKTTPGKQGLLNTSSYDFDGNGDLVNMWKPSELDLTASDSFSISVWFKTDDVSSSRHHMISTRESNANWLWIGTYNDVSGDPLDFQVKGDSNSNFVRWTGVSTGTWYHAVGTFNSGNDEVKLYVDGDLKGSASGSTLSGSVVTDQWELGRRSSSYPRWYDGKMYDVRIYNKTLSQSEIQKIYNVAKHQSNHTTNWKTLNVKASTLKTDSTIPADTSIDIKVEQDTGSDGTIDNTETITLSGGTGETNSLSNFQDKNGQYRVDIQLDNSNITKTANITKVKLKK